MSAGTGITHSEFNHSQTEPVHFLQIWIVPERQSLPPSYEQKSFSLEEKRAKLRLIAAPEGREGAVTIHQDVELYASVLAVGEEVKHHLKPNRHAWVQVAKGSVSLNGKPLAAGDGAAIEREEVIAIEANQHSEVLLFDLA